MLSRKPLPMLNTVTPACLWYARKMEEVRTRPQDHPDYQIIDGKLHRRFWDQTDLSDTEPQREWKLCVPTERRQEVLEENHDRPVRGSHGNCEDTGSVGTSVLLARYVSGSNYVCPSVHQLSTI